MKSLNDTAWEKLFEEHEILQAIQQNGFIEITSKQINVFRESRLMTKFDHINNLPSLFTQNGLSILPITRGRYIIGNFQTHEKIKYKSKSNPSFIERRTDLESLDYNNIYSESAALNCAYASGIIQNVIGENCFLTVNGRMSSGKFDFLINQSTSPGNAKNISVINSQCEIDGGFEGESKLVLIEAKNVQCNDFLIRQLYYPYRLWQNKVKKEVIPVFMTFSNDEFNFFVYKFNDLRNYNSIELIEQKSFIISTEAITLEDIKELLNTPIVGEPNVPFPQADSFARIVDLLGLLVEDNLTKEQITTQYDFNKRQTDYYLNAGVYLGLIKKNNNQIDNKQIEYELTEKARTVLNQDQRNKNLGLAKQILSHKAFQETLKLYLEKSRIPTKNEIVEVIKKDNSYADSTNHRRAQTVLKWTEWIISLTNDY